MKQVMVVDDEILLAQIIGELLQDEGYDVLLANGSGAMLRTLESVQPDLIFLDVMLPDGDGREVVKEMQSNPRLCDIPVVLMSAGVALKNVDVSAAGFLHKPFDIDTLLEVVSDIVGPATAPGPSNDSLSG